MTGHVIAHRETPQPRPHHQQEMVQFQAVWHRLASHAWLIGLVTLSVIGLTAFFTARQLPVYQSATTIRIQDEAGNPLLEMAPQASGTGKLETEIMVLQSRSLAEIVTDSLDLGLQVLEPHRRRAEIFSTIDIPRSAAGGEF